MLDSKNLSGGNKGKKQPNKQLLKLLQVGKKFLTAVKGLAAGLKGTKLSWPSKSVGLKLFLIISVSIIGCVLTVGLISYSQAKNIVEENVSEASYQTVKQVTQNLNNGFGNYKNLSLQLIIDTDIQTNLGILARSKDSYETLQATRGVSSRLSNYIIGNSTVNGIALIPLKADGAILTGGAASGPAAAKLKELPWFKEVSEMEGDEMWLEHQEEGLLVPTASYSFGLARLIKTQGSKDDVYIMVIEISMDAIKKDMRM